MTDCAVADRDGAGFGQSNGRFSYDYGADKHHGAVRQLITGGLQVRAIRLDLHTHSVIHQCVSCPFLVHFCISALGRTRVPPHLGVLHQHVLARDPNVVQLQVSVIHLVEAELGADVTYNHACTHGGLNKSQLLQISYK